MKFIGQFIQDFIARFRNDVYLEDVSSGTIASGSNLGLDSNNKIVKASIAADANTTYSVSCVDGDNDDEEKIRLTGSDSSTDDVVLEAGTGLSIARSSDKITFTNTVSDTDTNTQNTYAISCVDGDSTDEEKIRLTQGGAAGAANDDIVLGASTGLSISRDGDKIVFTNTVSDTNTNQLTEFTLTGDGGSNQTIAHGNTLDIAGGNAITTAVGATDTVTINHDDTSSQASVNNSGSTYIQDVTLDTYGHVTGLTSAAIPTLNQDTTGEAGTVATIAGLAPNTATTQATQPNITTLAGLTSFGAAGATTDIAAGDLTMYNAVNNGNPTFSIGSSATNRLVIQPVYNSGAQTVDYVEFNTFTSSTSNHDGRYFFKVDEVEIARLIDTGALFQGLLQTSGDGAKVVSKDTQASSTTTGAEVELRTDDGAAMADNHRLGIIKFTGAENASNTITTGAQIEAFCEAAWSASENGARLVFSTTDGNASTSTVLTLDSDKLATFTGPIACTTRTLAVTSSTDGDANGDVAYFGGTTSMTVGKIYHYKSDGTWEIANADAVSTADGLLAVALGAASDTNGMLLRGMVTLDHDPGAIGDVLYVQSDNAGTPGNATATAPSASGDCVRIIGYQVSHASNGNIWFNPDNTFVEVA